jgi:hypothetical protein
MRRQRRLAEPQDIHGGTKLTVGKCSGSAEVFQTSKYQARTSMFSAAEKTLCSAWVFDPAEL